MDFNVDISVSENGRKKPEYTLKSDLDGNVTLAEYIEFMKGVLVITADIVLKEEQARGFDKNPVITIDGTPGKPVKDVLPFGTIDITRRADMKDIILETYNGILSRSPVDTGKYKAHNYVFLNGQQVATDLASLTSWIAGNPKFEDKDYVNFVNIEPYARKLERLGVTADRQQSRRVRSRDKKLAAVGVRVLAPNGAYYLTWRSIRAKYKRNSVIDFRFLPGSRLGFTDPTKQHHFKTKRHPSEKSRTYLYPTIVISVQESGVL